MKSSFLPKDERKNVRNSALHTTRQKFWHIFGRNDDFINSFWNLVTFKKRNQAISVPQISCLQLQRNETKHWINRGFKKKLAYKWTIWQFFFQSLFSINNFFVYLLKYFSLEIKKNYWNTHLFLTNFFVYGTKKHTQYDATREVLEKKYLLNGSTV